MNNWFKFFLIFFVVCLIGFGLFSPRAFALEHAGIVKSLSGDVQIQRKNVFIPVLPGLKLMDADILITGAKGGAGIIFTDGTTLAIGSLMAVTHRRILELLLNCFFDIFFLHFTSVLFVF